MKKNVEALAAGGGYVFTTVNKIQNDVPARNVVAMLETFNIIKKY